MAGKKKILEAENNHIARLGEDTDIHNIREKINELIDVIDKVQFDIIRIDEHVLVLFKELLNLKYQIEEKKI